MRDYLNIGSTPSDESCAQVGRDGYAMQARRECRTFAEQLRRVFGPEPEGAHIGVKGFPHDFGTYYEVVCWYDDDMPESVKYAFKIESETPTEWDTVAREALGL